MEMRVGEIQRTKRKTRGEDDDKWECSVCTYINPSESYKCEICFMRKGTSTRKPRLNPQVVEQQQLIAQAILKEKDDDHRKKKERYTEKQTASGNNLKLKNFDRNAPLLFEIFANGYSVVITEFQLKSKVQLPHFPDSPAPSTCSSLQGFSGTPNIHPEQLSPVDSNPSVDIATNRGSHVPSYEYEFGDSGDSKSRSCLTKSFKGVISTGSSIGSSTYDQPHPTRSHSSASSSAGGTNMSRPSSPHTSVDPCLVDVKRDQEAFEAEQVAEDGDDEDDEAEDQTYRTRTWRVPSQTRRTKCSDLRKPDGSANCALRLPDATPEPALISRTPDLASSRPRRQHPRIDGPNPYVLPSISSTKRRKLSSGAYHYKLTIHGRRNGLEVSGSKTTSSNADLLTSIKTDSPSLKQERPSTKRRGSAINTPTDVRFIGHRETRTSKRKSTRSTRRSSSSRQIHESSLKPALKCRIRVPRSSLPMSTPSIEDESGSNNSSNNNDNKYSVQTLLPTTDSRPTTLNNSMHRTELDTATEGPTEGEFQLCAVPVSSQSYSRLSTESKNTSAMTDSSGASALEISH